MKKYKNNLVPRLRFPEFNKSPINFYNGNDIFNNVSDREHNSDLPILAISQEHGAIPREQIDYSVIVTDKSIESYKVVKIGDFIISLRSFQGGIEYSNYYGICSPAYIVLRKKIDIHENYYKYYFKTSKFIKELNRNIEGIRDGKMVSYGQFSLLLLPKPDINEQQKIADCLSSLDELITAEDEKLTLLKTYKKGLMQKLFPSEGETVPKFRFPEFRNSGEWEEKKLGEICIILNNKRKPISSSYRIKGIYPYYGASGIVDYVNDYLFDERLLLVGEDGAKWGAYEDTAFIADGKYWVNNHAHVLKPTKIDYVLLKNYLIKFDLNPFITGAAPPKLTLGKLKEIPILVTTTKEQQKIADCLSSLDELINAQDNKIKKLKEHKKGLMQGLFPSAADIEKGEHE